MLFHHPRTTCITQMGNTKDEQSGKKSRHERNSVASILPIIGSVSIFTARCSKLDRERTPPTKKGDGHAFDNVWWPSVAGLFRTRTVTNRRAYIAPAAGK